MNTATLENSPRTPEPPTVGVTPLATGSEIEVGKTYALRHQRLGRATVKILRVDDEWIDTEIVSGTLRGMTDDWWPGDTKTVRRSHCTFFPNVASEQRDERVGNSKKD